jgi:uncharacterized protein YlxP (DUF503 family)
MPVVELVVQFHLPGCRSLKERRGRLRGLRDRFGRQAGIAVFETPQAHVQHAQWHFIAASSERRLAQRQLDEVLQFLEQHVDARLTVRSRQELTATTALGASSDAPDNDALIDAFFSQAPRSK